MTRRKPDFYTYTPRQFRVGTVTEFGIVTRVARTGKRVATIDGGQSERYAVYCEKRDPAKRDIRAVLHCRRIIRQTIGAAEFRRWMKQHTASPIPVPVGDNHEQSL